MWSPSVRNVARSPTGWVDIQREEFKRLGVTGNWDDPYLTMDYHAEAVIADEFMKLLMNGTLYQGSKPVMWSPVEKTAWPRPRWSITTTPATWSGCGSRCTAADTVGRDRQAMAPRPTQSRVW